MLKFFICKIALLLFMQTCWSASIAPPLNVPMIVKSTVNSFVDIPFRFSPWDVNGTEFVMMLLKHKTHKIAYGYHKGTVGKFAFYESSQTQFRGRLVNLPPLTLRITNLTFEDNTMLHGHYLDQNFKIVYFEIEIKVEGGPFICGNTTNSTKYNVLGRENNATNWNKIEIQLCGNPQPHVTFVLKNKTLNRQIIQVIDKYTYKYVNYLSPSDLAANDCGSFIELTARGFETLKQKIRLAFDNPPPVKHGFARKNSTCVDISWEEPTSGNCTNDFTYRIYSKSISSGKTLRIVDDVSSSSFKNCGYPRQNAYFTVATISSGKESLYNEDFYIQLIENNTTPTNIPGEPYMCGEHAIKPVYTFKTPVNWYQRKYPKIQVSLCQNLTYNGLSAKYHHEPVIIYKTRINSSNEYNIYLPQINSYTRTVCGGQLEISVNTVDGQVVSKHMSLVHILGRIFAVEYPKAYRFNRCIKTYWGYLGTNSAPKFCGKVSFVVKYLDNQKKILQEGATTDYFHVLCFSNKSEAYNVTSIMIETRLFGRKTREPVKTITQYEIQDFSPKPIIRLDHLTIKTYINAWTLKDRVSLSFHVYGVFDKASLFVYIKDESTSAIVATGSYNFFINNYNNTDVLNGSFIASYSTAEGYKLTIIKDAKYDYSYTFTIYAIDTNYLFTTKKVQIYVPYIPPISTKQLSTTERPKAEKRDDSKTGLIGGLIGGVVGFIVITSVIFSIYNLRFCRKVFYHNTDGENSLEMAK